MFSSQIVKDLNSNKVSKLGIDYKNDSLKYRSIRYVKENGVCSV